MLTLAGCIASCWWQLRLGAGNKNIGKIFERECCKVKCGGTAVGMWRNIVGSGFAREAHQARLWVHEKSPGLTHR